MLELEKEALGFYITGHPMDDYAEIIRKFASVNTVTLQDVANEKMVRIAGNLKVQKIHKTKKGDLMAFCSIEDQYSTVELVVFPALYAGTHTRITSYNVCYTKLLRLALHREGYPVLFFFYPDDQNIDASSQLLFNTFSSLSFAGPVVLVGHSMGGLVARHMLVDPGIDYAGARALDQVPGISA